MHLTGMDIRDTPPFTELVELDFDARVNVFIGPNASGKSTVLREIDAAFNRNSRPEPSSRHYRVEPKYHYQPPFNTGAGRRLFRSWDWKDSYHQNFLFTREDWDESEDYGESDPPAVYIGPVRPALPELYDEESTNEDEADVGEALSRPFSGTNFKIANEKMKQMAGVMFDQERKEGIPLDERRAHRIFEVDTAAYPCVRTICSEVITGNGTLNYIQGIVPEELYYQALAGFDAVKIHRSLGITTVDEPNFVPVRPEDRPIPREQMEQAPLYAGFLSSGTQTTFLWIHWLTLKMLHHYEFAEGWQNEPAILLIDEIENHLHPTWQRRVIPALLEHFPGLQIFATTHSPFVVAGLRAGQVHLLSRNSDGVVESTTTEQDIIGWTTDEILRSFMGVDQPTDELTIRRSNRLRELRRKESLSDEEREELETLRREVNADILSSRSSLELQDERYADMMMRFIEARQNELSQDNR